MKISIKHKIFCSLLITSLVSGLGLHFLLRWNLERSFSKYVQAQELANLTELATRLTEQYSRHESWNFIQDNKHLIRMIHRDLNRQSQSLAKIPPPPSQPLPPPSQQKPPHQRQSLPNAAVPKLLLLDANKNIIVGPRDIKERAKEFELRKIEYNGNIAGYLSIIPPDVPTYERDRFFLKDQITFFAIVTFCMVLFSILVSYPITMHLLKPIQALAKGTRKLIAGQFKSRIDISSQDELGLLSKDFNTLAITLEKNELNRKQLVADTSHELRTPLTILRGEVEAIQDGLRQPNKENIAALHGEIMHLERLIEDLYELSKSDVGALNYKKTIVSSMPILEHSIDLFQTRYEEKGLTIKHNIVSDKASPLILADPVRIQQLFTNILENSLRYTDAPGTIEIWQETNKEQLIVCFADSSPSVPIEQLPYIFERLYRVEYSRNRATGGSGLGLAICKNIVEAHEGHISVESSALGGILIKIKLPKK